MRGLHIRAAVMFFPIYFLQAEVGQCGLWIFFVLFWFGCFGFEFIF